MRDRIQRDRRSLDLAVRAQPCRRAVRSRVHCGPRRGCARARAASQRCSSEFRRQRPQAGHPAEPRIIASARSAPRDIVVYARRARWSQPTCSLKCAASRREDLATRAADPERRRCPLKRCLVRTWRLPATSTPASVPADPTAGKLADCGRRRPSIRSRSGGAPTSSDGHSHGVSLDRVARTAARARFPQQFTARLATKLRAWPLRGSPAGARRVFEAIEARTTRIRPGGEVAPSMRCHRRSWARMLVPLSRY